jgi:hypothetical protein
MIRHWIETSKRVASKLNPRAPKEPGSNPTYGLLDQSSQPSQPGYDPRNVLLETSI